MVQLAWTSGGTALAVALSVSALGLVPAQAEEIPAANAPAANAQGEALVMPFTDVPEDHWAYQALLNLAGVYGCVGGYPDGTFRGDNAVTRYEFAAGMESCLGVLNTLWQQQQAQQQQAISDLIEAMEQSLQELRGLEERP
ncbi:MAG: hypothetical protein RLZZ597_3325 [Cyanobacteriota bacterium]|jgi:hypothetical protein